VFSLGHTVTGMSPVTRFFRAASEKSQFINTGISGLTARAKFNEAFLTQLDPYSWK